MAETPQKVRKVLITGAGGFIGFHTCKYLLDNGQNVIAADSKQAWGDSNDIRAARLSNLLEEFGSHKNFESKEFNIACATEVESQWDEQITHVVHLAAKAGVRDSMVDPSSFAVTNLNGFFNMLNCAKKFNVRHFLYASSSSVYGSTAVIPFAETNPCNKPMSLYAATKCANELIAYSYSYLYNLQTTGLRFFTVYGPWGRPDMAVFSFTRNILEGKPIQLYNQGTNQRSFTYIDDVVTGIYNALFAHNKINTAESRGLYQIYNIGSDELVSTKEIVKLIERFTGKKALASFVDGPTCDMLVTHADLTKAKQELGYAPQVGISEGIEKFVNWYKTFYEVKNI